MPNLERSQVEKSKPDFSTEEILRARSLTWDALNRIRARIQPGMLEDEAMRMTQTLLQELGAGKNWHRVYVRFGKNTLKPYGTPSEPDTRLGENDIYFLDIGPVWNGYEGDGGDTYVTGDDPDMLRCKTDCRALFDLVKAEWKKGQLSGVALYDFASRRAEELGWELNLDVNGHRVADFPHALYFKGSMTDVDWSPASHIWVLEIQIRHPSRDFGAFYEDLLF